MMKENFVPPKECCDNQRRVFIDTVQVYEVFIPAFRTSRSYRGGMHGKKRRAKNTCSNQLTGMDVVKVSGQDPLRRKTS